MELSKQINELWEQGTTTIRTIARKTNQTTAQVAGVLKIERRLGYESKMKNAPPEAFKNNAS